MDSGLGNPMTSAIWAVSCGSYSDYQVDAIFESKTDAEAYCDERAGDYPDEWFVESFDYYPAGSRPQRLITYHHTATVDQSGDLFFEKQYTTSTFGPAPKRKARPKASQTNWVGKTKVIKPAGHVLYGRDPVTGHIDPMRATEGEPAVTETYMECTLEVSGPAKKAVDKAFHDRHMQLKAEAEQRFPPLRDGRDSTESLDD